MSDTTTPLILPKAGTFEFEEKCSRFLSYCAPIQTEDDAWRVIAKTRVVHSKASHNVYVYSLSENNRIRFSDDGEPHGTAGMPILNVFQKTGVIDFICIVTRYFGGTLLGSGRLVRAYTKAAKGAMDAAAPTQRITTTTYRVTFPYSNHDTVKYNFGKWGIEILEELYTEQCTLIVNVKEAHAQLFLQGMGYSIEII